MHSDSTIHYHLPGLMQSAAPLQQRPWPRSTMTMSLWLSVEFKGLDKLLSRGRLHPSTSQQIPAPWSPKHAQLNSSLNTHSASERPPSTSKLPLSQSELFFLKSSHSTFRARPSLCSAPPLSLAAASYHQTLTTLSDRC